MNVQCCVVGSGPAGLMLGFLLARAGVSVAVLEKHADFFRDFRGDTIHPSTLEIMHELGLLDGLLALPHQEVRELGASIGGQFMQIADFTHVPTHCKFLAFMPQWDFLNFLAAQAKGYPSFDLRMEADVHDLLWADGRVTGVRASQPNDELEVRADLVVGADGRHSIVREKAGLIVDDFGAPMDVLWFRISRRPDDPRQALGWLNHGKLLIMIDRTDYFQCGLTIRKGTYEQIKQRGVDAFRADIASLAPFLRERLSEIPDWDQIRLLAVVVNIAREWSRPGLLCIGDAAHAMSPIGGVGINLAIQDAVAATNILARSLRASAASAGLLAQVQRRREFPTRVTQRAQVFIQNQLINRFLGVDKPMSPPWPLRLLNRWPLLRRLPAQLVGIGVRPEHVKAP
ncbi:MAG TPA: FAD-dependent oxidoreductase [Candidatus Eremiobacteraceae bacterium]|jgi:2-polyprenyl-6-methoxyphenol hydroxylase-like FAD-dependent oxidoreductase|nr:FAD-dependent oxidoreductase [Candidatus Eremiobacteraceae bacterium]